MCKNYLFLLFITSTAIAQQDEQLIREVLSRQVDCWNDEDIECFMEGYWDSEKLVFVGKSGIIYGWQSILERYKKNYPDKASMGKLSFDIQLMEPLSDHFWYVVGKWSLNRKTDHLTGHFSLIFRNIDERWLIVSDHSS